MGKELICLSSFTHPYHLELPLPQLSLPYGLLPGYIHRNRELQKPVPLRVNQSLGSCWEAAQRLRDTDDAEMAAGQSVPRSDLYDCNPGHSPPHPPPHPRLF